MSKPSEPAFLQEIQHGRDGHTAWWPGMSKREYAAIEIAKARLASTGPLLMMVDAEPAFCGEDQLIQASIHMAEKLLAALEEEA